MSLVNGGCAVYGFNYFDVVCDKRVIDITAFR